MSPLDSREPSPCAGAAGCPRSASLSLYYAPSNDVAHVLPLQRAAIQTEMAEGQGLGPGQRFGQGPREGGRVDGGAAAAAGEVASVRDEVARLVETLCNNHYHKESVETKGSNDAVKSVVDTDDGVNHDIDVVDGVAVHGLKGRGAYLGKYLGCISDQAVVEYATGTALPLLDAALRRWWTLLCVCRHHISPLTSPFQILHTTQALRQR